jgi:hypothetical protein
LGAGIDVVQRIVSVLETTAQNIKRRRFHVCAWAGQKKKKTQAPTALHPILVAAAAVAAAAGDGGPDDDDDDDDAGGSRSANSYILHDGSFTAEHTDDPCFLLLLPLLLAGLAAAAAPANRHASVVTRRKVFILIFFSRVSLDVAKLLGLRGKIGKGNAGPVPAEEKGRGRRVFLGMERRQAGAGESLKIAAVGRVARPLEGRAEENKRL